MITVTADPATGRVLRIGTADATLPPGAVEIPAIPPEPAPEPGTVVVPWLEAGALVWKTQPAPEESAQ